MQQKYYEAYDNRYRQIHGQNLQWASDQPSAIVAQTMERFSVSSGDALLEIGCGEGRDAAALLRDGYHLLATDISPEAIRYCREKFPAYAERFQRVNCVTDRLEQRFDFIYAVAVVHMLVADEDRDGFYAFVREHLKPRGVALICTMGDGQLELQSDVAAAFDVAERIHEGTGKMVQVAGTSCRMVSFETFDRELRRNGLAVLSRGLTAVEPDFSQMMYAVVQRAALD